MSVEMGDDNGHGRGGIKRREATWLSEKTYGREWKGLAIEKTWDGRIQGDRGLSFMKDWS